MEQTLENLNQGKSKSFPEIENQIALLGEEIDALHKKYVGSSQVDHIIDLKAEISTALEKILALKHEQAAIGKDSALEMQQRVEKGSEIQAQYAWIKQQEEDIKKLEEGLSPDPEEQKKKEAAALENMKNPEQIVWLELPSRMTLQQANEWIASENTKNSGQKYELASIEELQEAFEKRIDHFKKEVYLSGTPDIHNKGNALGLNFETGLEETIPWAQTVAVKVKTAEVK